jgi:hypothetical protein
MTRALRVRPSHDDELGAVETLALDPRAAVAAEIGPVNPLGDDALQAVQATLREWLGRRLSRS